MVSIERSHILEPSAFSCRFVEVFVAFYETADTEGFKSSQ